MKKAVTLKGVVPAVITPLDDNGEIDHQLLEKQAAYLCAAGVDGLMIGGTTSEGAYLSTEQKRKAFQTVSQVADGRQFLCLACIRPSTEMVIEEIKSLADLKPDFLVSVTPFYGTVRNEHILAHYREVAAASEAPLVLYNIPGRTSSPMTVETIVELADNENIVGIKDSSGDFVLFSRGLLSRSPASGSPASRADFVWIQGEDYLDAASLLLGCDGIVTGLGNVRIEPYVEMYRAAQAGNWDLVKACQRRINHIYGIIRTCQGKVNAAVKAGAAFYGRSSPRMKMSFMTLSEEEVSRVENILKSID